MERTKTVWYSLERRTSGGGNWVEEGVNFDTYEEALEELKFYKDFMPEEKFRIAEHHGFVAREKG